jgi:hypothetical protein
MEEQAHLATGETMAIDGRQHHGKHPCRFLFCTYALTHVYTQTDGVLLSDTVQLPDTVWLHTHTHTDAV